MGTLSLGISIGTKVEATNQGQYIKDGSIVQITKQNYDIWQNFNWNVKNNTNNIYNQTFEAKGRYQHKNGQTYYSLFDHKGNWQGYLNAKATKKTSKQGNYISDGSYVKISKGNYEVWQNFGWQLKNNTNNLFDQTLQARGRYQHFNGSTYYSLFDGKGNWQGYLNAGATKKTNAQGNYIEDGRYIQITKNYELWQNFNWKKKGNGSSHYNKSLQARGKYQHFNGNTYYSLFEENGNWIGYINASATLPYKSKKTQSTETINKDTSENILKSTSGYTYVSESTDGGKTKTALNGDTHTTYTITKVWKKNKEDELKLGIPTYSLSMTAKFEEAINSYRQSQNVYNLEVNKNSRIKSDKTASKNISSDWTQWSAQHSGEQIGTTWSSTTYYSEGEAVSQAMANFINSPGHRYNLLEDNQNFAEFVGASVYSMKSLDAKTGAIMYSYLFIATIDASW